MSYREPEPAPGGYTENPYTWFLDEERGAWIFGERLDPRSGLSSLDEQVEPQPTPEGGWQEGTVMVEQRPVLPLSPSHRAEKPKGSQASLPSVPHRAVATRRPRRGSSRERRGRPSRRTGSPSRDGPSDSSEGDGEGPPSPATSSGVAGRPRRSKRSNSQQGEGFFGAWSVDDHGIDTVSYAFRPPGRAALDAMAMVLEFRAK